MIHEPLGTIHPFDSSSEERSFVLTCASGAQIRISETAQIVLTRRWGGASFEEIARELRDEGLSAASGDELERYHRRLADKVAALSVRASDEPSSFALRFTLLPQAVVERIAAWFTFAYGEAVAVAAALFIVAACAVWLPLLATIRHTHYGLNEVVIGYGLFLISLLFHEFGHAAACKRFGARPGAIGFTLYLTFPALYSDVSTTWRLPRWQRVVVDVGGTYFQFVVIALYMLGYAGTHWGPLPLAVSMAIGIALFNLNPLFKFDGYWIVADALGVPNLGQQYRKVARIALRRAKRRPNEESLGWPRPLLAAIVAYSLAMVAMWTYFAIALVIAMYRSELALVGNTAALLDARHAWELADAWHIAGALFTLVVGAVVVRGLLRRTQRLIRSAVLSVSSEVPAP
jgi:putative peptide zinc metalloprotease protein